MLNESGRKVARFIFNDDKVIRVNIKTGEVLTSNVSSTYTNLISIYLARYKARQTGLKTIIDKDNDNYDDYYDADREEYSTKEKAVEIRHETRYCNEKIKAIRSGKGAGLGVFLGLIVHIMPIVNWISGLASFSFLNNMCNRDYLLNTDTSTINFRKGFYSASVFGGLVAIAACNQWKTDMISVLSNNPNPASINRHGCFKAWFWILTVLSIIGIFAT